MQASQKRMNFSIDCNENRVLEYPVQQPKTLDARTPLRRLLSVLSRICPPAMLYRIRSGERPYDYGRPQIQREYQEFHSHKWNWG